MTQLLRGGWSNLHFTHSFNMEILTAFTVRRAFSSARSAAPQASLGLGLEPRTTMVRTERLSHSLSQLRADVHVV